MAGYGHCLSLYEQRMVFPVLTGFFFFWSLSCVRLLATPWTVACQAPLFMGFSRQEYWSGLSLPSPGDLPDPGIKPRSPALSVYFLLIKEIRDFRWSNGKDSELPMQGVRVQSLVKDLRYHMPYGATKKIETIRDHNL